MRKRECVCGGGGGGGCSMTIQKFNNFQKNSNISGCLTPRALAVNFTMFPGMEQKSHLFFRQILIYCNGPNWENWKEGASPCSFFPQY